MEMTGEFRIPAPRQRVWEGLNDPEILKQSHPGLPDDRKSVRHRVQRQGRRAVGPVKATFGGKVTLSDLDPPQSYTISWRGQRRRRRLRQGRRQGQPRRRRRGDGAALCRPGPCWRQARAIGSRLIDGVARKMADDFFGRFAAAVAPEPAAGGSGRTCPGARPRRLPLRPQRAGRGPAPDRRVAAPSPGRPPAAAGGVGHRAGSDRHRDPLFFHPGVSATPTALTP